MAMLNEVLAEIPDPKTRRSRALELMTSLVSEGIDGNVRATLAILDRVHGRVESRLETARFEEHLEAAAAAAADRSRAIAMVTDLFAGIDTDTASEFLDALQSREAGETLWELARRFGLPTDKLGSEPEVVRYSSLTEALRDRLGLIKPESKPAPEPLPPPRTALPCGFHALYPPPMIRPARPAPIEPEPPKPTVAEWEWYSLDGGDTYIKIER